MKKFFKIICLLSCLCIQPQIITAQIDTAFWFAAPWSTPDHTERHNIVVHLSTFGAPSTTIHLRQPAAIAPNKYDTIIVVGPNTTFDYIFWRDKLAAGPPSTLTPNVAFDSLETKPANQIVPYGLYISSSSIITVVYDVICQPPNFNNPETFSLKGQNGLGREFVCPQQTLYRNRTLGDRANTPSGVLQPKQQIAIVATEANTVVWITPRCNVVGHPANVTYSIMLPAAGSCYNIENSVMDTYLPGKNLSGTIIVADKPIAVTVADDSINNVHSSPAEPGKSSWGGMGCYDLIGDQIVPVDVVGKDYIINRGQLFRENQLGAGHPGMKESAFIVATENFTQLTINAGGVPTFTYLNKGSTFVDTLTTDLTYIHADKNVYVYHVSGIGCELGAAILPPLTCAGSKLVAFSRNTPQQFALNVLCKNGSQNTFTLNGSTALIPASAFTMVPGTSTLAGGPFWGAQVGFNTTTLPIGSYTIGNNADEFALGVFDGGTTTGGLFHYMSSFLRRTVVETETLNPICSGQAGTVAVTGTITGADITGIWTTSYYNGSVTVSGGATGSFSPVYSSSVNVISTIYSVSINDTTSIAPTKTITLYLSSTGSCRSVTDSVKLVINQRPKVLVSSGTILCKNNIQPVVLSGTVSNAVSGQWSGGNGGAFGVPGLVTTYTPSAADMAANTITLYLTSQAPLSGCPNTVNSTTVNFINPPVVTIVPNNTVVCTNSSTVALNGNISGVTTTGIWLGGTGAYTLTNTSPTSTYILSPSDLTQSAVTLTLTSTNNGLYCASESATMQINIIDKPVLNLPGNFTVCADAGTIALSGTVSGSSSQGMWSTNSGFGGFSNQQIQVSPVISTYSINSLDTLGYLYFNLESAPGICPIIEDSVKVTILEAPRVTVNQNFLPVCRNAVIALTGTVSGYTNSGIWSTSSTTSTPGTFTPGANFLNGFYVPSESDYDYGFVNLTLTSTNNQQCPASFAMFTASFVPSPSAFFSFGPKRCLNAPVFFQDASTTNGTADLTYEWDFGDGFGGGGSTVSNPVKTYTSSGQYIVTLTVTGISNLSVSCSDAFDTIIRIKPLPIADFTVTPACASSSVVFTNKSIAPPGSDPINRWQWEFGDSILFNVPPLITSFPTTTVAHTYATSERFSAYLTVTATPAGFSPSLGCVSDPYRVYVDVFPKPTAEFGLTNNPTVVKEPVYFSDFTTPVGNIAAWFWEFGDDGASSEQAPVHVYEKAGIFSVKLTVTDKAGCQDTLRKDIDVTLLPQVPKAFSPNGDGLNDLLYVKGGPFETFIFRVYNNWGEIVWETNDQNAGWDGKKNGVDQPVGIYVWTLIVDMYNNRQVKKNGDITLIR